MAPVRPTRRSKQRSAELAEAEADRAMRQHWAERAQRAGEKQDHDGTDETPNGAA